MKCLMHYSKNILDGTEECLPEDGTVSSDFQTILNLPL